MTLLEADRDGRAPELPLTAPAAARPARPWARAAGWARRHRGLLVGGVALGLLSLPRLPLEVKAGLDPSWQFTLHYAARHRLVFGRDVLFAEGPLGFLTFPALYYSSTGLLAIAVQVATRVAVAVAALALLRRRFGWVASVAVALPFLWLLTEATADRALESVWLLIAVWWAVTRLTGPTVRCPAGPALAAGALAGAVVLVKLDAASGCLVVFGAAVFLAGFGSGGLRLGLLRAAQFTGAAIASVLLLWVLAGQPLGAFVEWLRGAREIVQGYTQSMGIEAPGTAWEYVVGALLAAWTLASVWSTSGLGSRRRAALLVLVALALLVVFRQGFTRHDGHSAQFFLMLAGLPLAFADRWPPVRTVLIVGVSLLSLGRVLHVDWPAVPAPGQRLEAVRNVAELMVSSGARADRVEEQRAALRASYALPPEIADRLPGRTLHVLPSEASVLYAYPDSRWRPGPVFQDYSAYTRRLDDLDAGFLAGPGAPRQLLRQLVASIDTRLARWEPPAAMLEQVCRYRIAVVVPGWQLLERTGDRCERPRPGGWKAARFGDRVPVPPSGTDQIVLARFRGVDDTLGDRVRTAIWKPRELFAQVDDPGWNRFVPGTQGSWHVVAVPACAAAQVFMDPGARPARLELSDRRGPASARDRYDVEFATVPFRCPPAPG